MDFGKIVKRILLDKDMQQKQLADIMDLSTQSLHKFLTRKDHRINADIIPYCDALGFDVEITFRDRQSGRTISADQLASRDPLHHQHQHQHKRTPSTHG